MFNINKWFVRRYMRDCAREMAVPTDEEILAQLNQRIDQKRYRYSQIVDLRGYIIPVLRYTIGTNLYSVDLVHVSDRGKVIELESATVLEDQVREFLPLDVVRRCFNETKG